MIVLNAGKDATQLFEAYHPEYVTDKKLASHEIGVQSSSEYPTFPPESKFFRTLKERVSKYFRDNKIKRTDGWPMVVRSGVFAFLSLALWALAVQVTLSSGTLWLGGFLAALVGVVHGLISLMPVHEASHGATTSSPSVWRMMGLFHDWLLGASYYNWLHQHLLGHHPFTSIEQLDPDVVTGDPDARRIKTSQQLLSLYRWQHIYMPLLYGLLAAKFRVNDLTIVFGSKKNGQIRMNDPGPWHMFHFVAGKLFWLMSRFVVPAYFIGIWQAAVLVSISDVVTSYYLALVFQVNHVVSEAIWPQINDKNEVEMDWAELQVRTTIDYAVDSPITTFFAGGLNFQVVHHLFPGICQLHYPKIAPIVYDTCKEFGVPFVVLPTYWDALKAHIRFLKIMGEKDHPACIHH